MGQPLRWLEMILVSIFNENPKFCLLANLLPHVQTKLQLYWPESQVLLY